jgi:hypothetical protein
MTSKRPRKDGGLSCGATTFVLVPSLNADRIFDWKAVTRCLDCGERFTLKRGEAAAVLRIGNEIAGAVCPECLTAESRQQLQSMRGEQVQP